MIDRFEVEFFPVGEGEKSGDCILFHYFENGEERILVYDGGTKKSGEALVNHVRRYYDKDKIDYMINSHPDMDHISGLIYIAEHLEVGEIWMHKPWEHSRLVRELFQDQRITDSSLVGRLKAKLVMADKLETLARNKGIPVYEPYAGETIGPFTVLSPDKDWYLNDLLPDFTKSPEKLREDTSTLGMLLRKIESATESAKGFIEEKLGFENLPDDVETSAENDSSVILYGVFDNEGFLLMGDSGVRAIHRASDYARDNCHQIGEYIKFVQVPHHGSRNNVSTEALNNLLGKPSILNLLTGNFYRQAVVSASKNSTKHPRDRVVNAFIRRGFNVVTTQGKTIQYKRGNMPDREGWSTAPKLEFFHRVEDI